MESMKKDFLAEFATRQLELGRVQREYRRLLDKRLFSRKQKIFVSGIEKKVAQLRAERDELRAKIFVADGASNQLVNDYCLDEIDCHVECQEGLMDSIRDMKLGIQNLDREIARTHKVVLSLSRQTMPDMRFLVFVERWRKKVARLADQKEVSIRRECALALENSKLREQLQLELHRRHSFNDYYTKQVVQLNSDKKYMMELIEYACTMYDNCINAFERFENARNRADKDREERKKEMQTIMRKIAADGDANAFLRCKTKPRELADLQPKEYRRREQFRLKHECNIKLYQHVLRKIKNYTESGTVEEVIEKFKEQESVYYSYFSYANEMGYHMELLDRSVKHLFIAITQLKQEENDTLEGQLATIETLEETLERAQEKKAKLQQQSDDQDQHIETLLGGFQQMFDAINADYSPVLETLGDNENINVLNARHVLKIFEQRLKDVIACVYVTERKNEKKTYADYRVKEIGNDCEPPTEIADIVLTQQCPECAEGEAFAMDEGDEGVKVQTVQEAKKKLYEKVQQPEMQYRLHSISQCRLPRSRMLAAKKNM